MKYKNFKTLSADDMKQIVGGYAPEEGGGSCCWHSGDWMAYNCGLSQSAAQSGASYYAANNGAGNHGYWCCASCPS